MRVAEILKVKGSMVMAVRPAQTIRSLTQRFRQEGVGAMIVSDDNGSLDGIITERDVAYGLAVHGCKLLDLPASALMTTAVVTCSPDDSIAQVARVMTERRIRHLPVKVDRRLVGIVSIGDVLKYRIAEMQVEAHVLRDIAVACR